eukprot:CAMPEP_0119561280 /NCGR_PEP_ID=MMETSP1352-20130426/17167_1 /TAXON_ID=265584 /ORGANISM="Stauroneis constricta, Strain CCMP1120" /LENGTH=34 /DNA_ID= /DNA_START= /DNA_END= /DNA_ORIENTATION=
MEPSAPSSSFPCLVLLSLITDSVAEHRSMQNDDH